MTFERVISKLGLTCLSWTKNSSSLPFWCLDPVQLLNEVASTILRNVVFPICLVSSDDMIFEKHDWTILAFIGIVMLWWLNHGMILKNLRPFRSLGGFDSFSCLFLVFGVEQWSVFHRFCFWLQSQGLESKGLDSFRFLWIFDEIELLCNLVYLVLEFHNPIFSICLLFNFFLWLDFYFVQSWLRSLHFHWRSHYLFCVICLWVNYLLDLIFKLLMRISTQILFRDHNESIFIRLVKSDMSVISQRLLILLSYPHCFVSQTLCRYSRNITLFWSCLRLLSLYSTLHSFFLLRLWSRCLEESFKLL